jgi:hypothetical protein
MADALIFSRERPCQLDLLCRSIRRHAYYEDVQVLYRADSAEAIRGYMRVLDDHGEWLRFVPERNFEEDVRFWLSRANAVFSFLVDDDVFYRDMPSPITSPSTYALANLPLSFRGGDYDYPLSLDGNLYLRYDIEAVLREMPHGWSDPTQLEAVMHEFRHLAPFDRVHPCEPPCLTGIPANRVSVSSGMPHMGVDVAELNRAFLEGFRIDLDRLEEQLTALPPAAHTAIEYVLA